MNHLSIDIETYSSVDIKRSGLYKYAQAPDFQILLIAYSLNSSQVRLIDVARGEDPQPALKLLARSDVLVHAYNAAFEWYCLTQAFPDALDRSRLLERMRCTMLHGLYCGYTSGLAATGEALGLPSDKRKLGVGSSLIRTFCVPQKPTKTNGGRTRVLPEHEPEKWRLFGEYCLQDVATEMEIERRLANWPVPDDVQRQWVTDMLINARGVAVDMTLVRGAISIGAETSADLAAEAKSISGLDNPKSTRQLLSWLNERTQDSMTDLRKTTVADALTRGMDSAAATRILQIRQELGKTSTTKYNAMEDAACADGRIRGLLQYYGANRTGRWAGRLVQVQNLPRTYLGADWIPTARDLVREDAPELLSLFFGSIPDTLSQLIRTALVPAPGKLFADADFSAIEARVVAWLAGETWVLDVFRTHGRIYEATAAQMFGVPIDRIQKGNPEYELRQRGKVATLALGYQGGPAALTAMDYAHAIADEDKPELVRRWREANPNITGMWYDVEQAAISAAKGVPSTTHYCDFVYEDDGEHCFMTIRLPSGRKLFYAQPFIAPNRFGRDSLHHYGRNQTSGKWEEQETYGGKLVENITQAVARDCLATAIDRLEAAGLPVVFHVHDEIVCEVATDSAATDLAEMIQLMSMPIAWAPGLPLSAAGWINPWYTKE